MSALQCIRPGSLSAALGLSAPAPQADGSTDGARLWLAGGQSLLAAMKLGMVSPAMLIDLQDVPGLRDIRLEPCPGQVASPMCLWIGAMATHASVASSPVVRAFAHGLADLAGGIGDAQVRQMGTLGGSLAHNDPAACWPAGVLAAGATISTSRRELAADDYFQGLYSTALAPGELIVGVRFPRLKGLQYFKFEQPASRFALVGVAVAVLDDAKGSVRVVVTGLGPGVQRWPAAEEALAQQFKVAAAQALDRRALNQLEALGDLHASAAYRQHLALVLTTRCVSALGGGAIPQPLPLVKTRDAEAPAVGAVDSAPREGFGAVQALSAPPEQVWQTLLDPWHLQTCIPGCESLLQLSAEAYEATVKVGLGPLSVRFKTEVLLRDQRPPNSLTLIFQGNAGSLGSGQGTSQVQLKRQPDGTTLLDWWVQVQLGGRLAQFGNRLVEATARKLSGEFFERIGVALRSGDESPVPRSPAPWWRRLLQFVFPSFGK